MGDSLGQSEHTRSSAAHLGHLMNTPWASHETKSTLYPVDGSLRSVGIITTEFKIKLLAPAAIWVELLGGLI